MPYSIKNDVQILGLTILGNYTTAQRTTIGGTLGAGDAGATVFDTDLTALFFWDGAAWNQLAAGTIVANLSLGTVSPTSVEILIDTGTDVTIPSATNALAGVATATQITNLEALGALDGVAPGAIDLGTFTGTIIPDNETIKGALQALETDYETFKDSAGQPNGLATLDGSGTIPTSQLPALAITDVTVVADIAARDALTAQEGDVAKVTDAVADTGIPGQPQTYIYDGAAWIDIQETSDVVSVNGQTGTVVLSDADIAYDDTPAPAGSPTEGTTTVEGAIDALNAAVNTLNNVNNDFIGTFLVADWVGPASNRYTYTIDAATHNLTAADIATVQVQELISANNYRIVRTRVDINKATGDVTLTIRALPDARFDGLVVITQND